METDLQRACDTLRHGGVILYPTDTVWGIGCDATDSKAVRRVFDIKRRADSKALIVLVGSLEMLRSCVDDVPAEAYGLISASRPTTLVLDGARNLAANLISDDGSVGVRMTSESFSKSLCDTFGYPIVSTSANISGEPSPSAFSDISPDILNAVDYVCTTRRDDMTAHTPSRILKIDSKGHIQVIRP